MFKISFVHDNTILFVSTGDHVVEFYKVTKWNDQFM